MSALVGVRVCYQQPEAEVVRRMLAAAPHRGDKTSVVTLGSVALGVSHNRDFPEASATCDGTVAVAFCGVLDNADQLRGEVTARGQGTVIATEADLVAAAFSLHGEQLAGRMRGTYAVAITDGETLWCFRDHFGFRSLFYHDGLEATFVASEVKQIVAGAGIAMRPDRDVVEQIFYGDYDDDTPTAVRNVYRLAKATLLTATNQRAHTSRYWFPERLIETSRPTPDEVQEGFDRLMAQAVQRCLSLNGDVVSLSGGVDSPIIAGYAAPLHRELTARPLPALSIVAPRHPSVDESDYIREVVDFLGIAPWHTYEQTVAAVAGLDRWVDLCDGPVPTITMNEIEQHYRHARAVGYRTILTGEFAEFVVDRPEGLMVHLLLQRRWRALRQQIVLLREHGRPRRRIVRELAGVIVPRRVAVRRERMPQRMGWARPSWLDEDRVAAGWARGAFAPRNRWRQRQLGHFFGPGLSLEGAEICQTASGVRVRRPWLDVDLGEFFLSLPAEVKYPELLRKSSARRLARGRVPDRILDRRDKTVFNDSMRARMDYDELKRWLLQPTEHLSGVDYSTLAARLERQELDLFEYRWARDLAAAHAFLELSDG